MVTITPGLAAIGGAGTGVLADGPHPQSSVRTVAEAIIARAPIMAADDDGERRGAARRMAWFIDSDILAPESVGDHSWLDPWSGIPREYRSIVLSRSLL